MMRTSPTNEFKPGNPAAARQKSARNVVYAARHSETGKGPNVLKSLKNLVGRIAIAIIEKRPAASQLTTGPF